MYTLIIIALLLTRKKWIRKDASALRAQERVFWNRNHDWETEKANVINCPYSKYKRVAVPTIAVVADWRSPNPFPEVRVLTNSAPGDAT